MLYSPKRSLRGIGIFEIPMWLRNNNYEYNKVIIDFENNRYIVYTRFYTI